MSNAWFACKQFTVHQDRCAMKVSTDACIQGAWTPVGADVTRVVDAGAGTGLLSLMIAQRAPLAMIDAVELDAAAASQLAENIAASPFAGRIYAHQQDVTTWSCSEPYDMIICNPPFFHASLRGPDAARNAARHSHSMNPDSLIGLIISALGPQGTASLMWPQEEHETFRKKAQQAGLCLQTSLHVRDRSGGRVTRIIGIYGREEKSCSTNELIIRNPDGSHTSGFIELLRPFYLRL